MNKPPDNKIKFPSEQEPSLSGGDLSEGFPFEWLVKAGLIDGRPYR